MDIDQLKQEMDRNTAIIGKISAWTRAGIKAHYVTKTEDQKRIDRGATVVFHPASTNVNTVTNAAQPKADKTPPNSDDEEDSSQGPQLSGPAASAHPGPPS